MVRSSASWDGIFGKCTCAFAKTLFSWLRAITQVTLCSLRYLLVHIDTKWMALTHAHLLSKRNSPLSRVVPLNHINLHIIYYFQFPASKYWHMNVSFVADRKEKNDIWKNNPQRSAKTKNKNHRQHLKQIKRTKKYWKYKSDHELSYIYGLQDYLRLFHAKKAKN